MADSIISYEDLIGQDDTFDVIFANIDQLKKELVELAQIQKNELGLVNPNDEEAVKRATKEVQNLTSAMKKLDTEEKKAQKTKKKANDLTNEELIQREKQKIANRERVQVAKQMAIMQSKESGEIEKLRAKLSLTTMQWKKLSKEELNNTKKGKDLIKTKKDLTNQLKKLEKQTGDNRRNVGNYASSLGKLGKVAMGVFVGRGIGQAIRKIGMAMGSLIDKNKETNNEIGALDESIKKFTGAFSQLGVTFLSFIAKPLTLLIEGLTYVMDLFSSPAIDKFSATSDKLAETTKTLNAEFVKEQATMQSLFTTLKNTNEGTDERERLIEQINKQYGKYLPQLLTEKSSLQDIEAAQKLVNSELMRSMRIKIQNATLTDVLTNKIGSQTKAFEDFQKTAKKAGITISDDMGFAYGQFLDNFDKFGAVSDEYFMSAYRTEEWKKMRGEMAKINPDLAVLAQKMQDVKESLLLMKKQYKITNNEKNAFQIAVSQAADKSELYNKAIDKSNKITKKLTAGLKVHTHTTKKDSKTVKESTKVYKDNVKQRIAAIQSLQDKIQKSEAAGEKDKTERLLALEDAKFTTLQTQREKDFDKYVLLIEQQEQFIIDFYGENSEEVIQFRKEAGDKLLYIEGLHKELSEAQFKESEKKKEAILETAYQAQVKITKDGEAKKLAEEEKQLKTQIDFRAQLTDLQIQNIEDDDERELQMLEQKFKKMRDKIKDNNDLTIDQRKELITEVDKLEINAQKELNAKIAEENKKAIDERTKEMMEGVSQVIETVGAKITEVFEKELDAASEKVTEQEQAVEEQRERAEKGLSNTLKFEQEQLAQNEANQIRAAKKAKEMAEIVALINLVSAYAASGDSNAMTRGLVDWSLLKALSAGFEEGGFTGAGSSNSDVKGLVHANEYVVTASDTAKFGLVGKGGGDFGEAISDYFYSPLQRNMYLDQKGRFNDGLNSPANTFNRLENEVRAMRRAFEDMPKNDFDIMQMTDYFVEISKRVTSNRMTNVSKQRKRL